MPRDDPLRRAALASGLAAAAIWLSVSTAQGQRVQFPSMVSDPTPHTVAQPPATSTAPPPTTFNSSVPTTQPVWDPYAAPTAPVGPTTTVDGAVVAGPTQPYYTIPGQPTPPPARERSIRFLQQLNLEYEFLADSNNQGLGLNSIETSATFAIPFFNAYSPFLVTPGFDIHLWDGPVSDQFAGSPDMPPQTYDAWLDTAWAPKITDRLSADLAVRVGVYSDFHNVNSDSIRILARGLGLYQVTPTWQLAAGIVYWDRLSVKITPAGGVIWTPNPDTRYELLFPRPKLSQRITSIRNTDLWGYIAGEYGGGQWTIRRADGSNDVVDYNDLRASLGLEWFGYRGMVANIEVGYVFNRDLDYKSGLSVDPKDTVMLRAGLSY